MKCEECLALLEEHADGEARAGDAARVEAHLDACAACARGRRRLEEERAVFLSYECDAAPAEGFWDDVLSKIEAEAGARAASQSPASSARPDSGAAGVRARLGAALGAFAAPRLSPALVAALLFVAVGATVAVMKYSAPREATFTRGAGGAVAQRDAGGAVDGRPASSSSNPGGAVRSGGAARNVDESAAVKNEAGAGEGRKVVRNTTGGGRRQVVADARAGGEERSARGGADKFVRVKSADNAESSSQEPAPDRLVREAEQKYLAAIRLLARDASGRRARLDADARARFEQTLAAVDRTIADTRRAAREHPRDPVAVQYMLTAYAKKVELLREMARD